MPKESLAFMEKLKEHAELERNQINAITNSSSDNNQTDSLTKSLYHLQSLVYNNSLPSTVLSKKEYSCIHSILIRVIYRIKWKSKYA